MPVTAQELIRWQTKMSNTAHQREMADLQAAGLNPILTTKYGGASVPSGAMDSGAAGGGGSGSPIPGTTYDPNDPIGNIINSLSDRDSIKLGPFNISGQTIKNIYSTVKGDYPEFIKTLNAFVGGNMSPQDVWNALIQNSKNGDPGFGSIDGFDNDANNPSITPVSQHHSGVFGTGGSSSWANTAKRVIEWLKNPFKGTEPIPPDPKEEWRKAWPKYGMR